jgi:SAM-dependent methyltransferase
VAVSKKAPSPKEKRPARETNQAVVRNAMLRRLPRRLGAGGQLVLPAAPSLAAHFAETLREVFAALGRVFSEEDSEHLRKVLASKLEAAFTISPYARVVVDYETEPAPSTALSYDVHVVGASIESEYQSWVENRTPPYFGVHPDAKIVACARSLGAPADVPVLDVGAGTGRNTLPLAREGFRTDAVELAPALASILRAEAEKENLPVRVFEANALARDLGLPERHYRLVCMAELIASHLRSVDEIRALFENAAKSLAGGGLLVFNAFVAKDGYRPDAMARELSQVFWCNLFTKAELTLAMQGLPFDLVSDESTHDFEAEHQPADGWPPTAWFVDWARGLDLFDLPGGLAPMDLRWLVYRRL